MKKPLVAIVDGDSAFANYLRTFLSLRGQGRAFLFRGNSPEMQTIATVIEQVSDSDGRC